MKVTIYAITYERFSPNTYGHYRTVDDYLCDSCLKSLRNEVLSKPWDFGTRVLKLEILDIKGPCNHCRTKSKFTKIIEEKVQS